MVNVEYWPFDQPLPRKLIPGPHGMDKIPDVPNFSWVEYGMRTGFPRIVDALKRRGLPASTMLNASVIDVYPRAAEVMLQEGWEFIGHGWTQKALQNEPDEAAVIEKCMEKIKSIHRQAHARLDGRGLERDDGHPRCPEITRRRIHLRLGR